MMTQNISLQHTANNVSNTAAFDLVAWIASLSWVRTLAALYSNIMEEEITPRFTLHLLNVQIAAFFALVPCDVDIIVRVLCLGWFASSLALAKRAYRSQSSHVL